jgi:hypothetical protein
MVLSLKSHSKLNTTMKNITRKLGVLLLFVASACQLDNDTLNPNNLTPGAADPDLLMNSIQLNFAGFYFSASQNTDQLVRMQAMTGGYRYQTAILPTSVDGLWASAYQGVLINTKTLIPLAQAKKLTTHVAMAKIMEAYVYMTLVDIFNDVPQSEALLGTNFAPKVDNATAVYDAAIALLGDARTELAKTGVDAGTNIAPGNDLFYSGSRTNWTALANSLELKAWMNIRMIASRVTEADGKITALLTSNLIDTEAENFTFKYGISTVPNSRHPLYNQYYGLNAGAAGGYISNYFMNELYKGRGVQDPRWRYYFYRQVGSVKPAVAAFDPKALGCTPGTDPSHYLAIGAVFCVFDPGFYGRDHGDASGTPPDSPAITCAGVYPAGGRADNNPVTNTSYNVTTKRGDGANGAGILPIYMNFFTDFVKAEIAARKGDAVGAQANLTKAVTNSIQAVKRFADGKLVPVTVLPWSSGAWTPVRGAQVACGTTPNPITPVFQNCAFNNLYNAYMDKVDTDYTAATSKLDVIGREFYVSAWGNGVEAYNSYRRTSAPRNFQPALQLNPGPFFRAFVYPQTFTALAGGTPKDPNAVNKVFWDTNPDVLN